MTLEEKKAALAQKQAEIEALQKELSLLEQDEAQVQGFQGLLSNGLEVKGLNIVVNPSTGEALKATITDKNGQTYLFSTMSQTTMHMTAINAALQHASDDVAQRQTDALAQLDALLA